VRRGRGTGKNNTLAARSHTFFIFCRVQQTIEKEGEVCRVWVSPLVSYLAEVGLVVVTRMVGRAKRSGAKETSIMRSKCWKKEYIPLETCRAHPL